MPYPHTQYLLSLFTLACLSTANAESIHPLQPRDLDGNPATIEAYYFVPGNITWLADANLGLSETFGLPRAEFFSDFGSEINLEGRILREGIDGFMNGMNTSQYLGYSNWRLPVADLTDPGCSVTNDPDFVWAVGENCSGAEVGEFNQFLNTFYGSIDDSPFINLAANNGNPELYGHWLSSRGPAGRHYFSFGGTGDLRFCGAGRCGGRYIWPVHDGDIGISPSQCIDTDGDGWGWNGVSSCRLAPVESVCEDTPPAGDGWGWNGVESCRLEVTNPVCEDTPPANDGWGWDGTTSCRIEVGAHECTDYPPLGDGWGWDGVSSCRIDSQVQTLSIFEATPECTDYPPLGDGWGWDGNQSCTVLPNLIRNGSFEEGLDYWTTYVHPNAVETEFTYANQFQDLRLNYLDAGTEWWHSQAYTAPFTLNAGQTYRLEFNFTSSSRTGNAVGSVVVENADTFVKHLDRQDFQIGIGASRARVDFTVTETDNNARLTFNLGDNFGGNNSSNRGVIWFDYIVLRAIE